MSKEKGSFDDVDSISNRDAKPSSSAFSLLTYNLSSGGAQLTERAQEYLIRTIDGLSADIVFLQNCPLRMYERFSQNVWPWRFFTANQTDNGLGSAALSTRSCLLNSERHGSGFFGAGQLTQSITVEFDTKDLLCLNTSFGWFGAWSAERSKIIAEILASKRAALVVGDYIDRTGLLRRALPDLRESYPCPNYNSIGRSYPSRMPLFKFDRVYARRIDVVEYSVLHGEPWIRSLHLPIFMRGEFESQFEKTEVLKADSKAVAMQSEKSTFLNGSSSWHDSNL